MLTVFLCPPKKAHWNLSWHICSAVQHARSGLDLIISWRFHLQGKIDWESSSRVQGELGDIRVSVPLGPWHLFVIVTQPLLDPPSVLLEDRSGFLPQMWTWGQARSLQQLRSVSSCLPHQFQFTERRKNVQSSAVADVRWTCYGYIQFSIVLYYIFWQLFIWKPVVTSSGD